MKINPKKPLSEIVRGCHADAIRNGIQLTPKQALIALRTLDVAEDALRDLQLLLTGIHGHLFEQGSAPDHNTPSPDRAP